MRKDNRRITLIARGPATPDRDWNSGPASGTRLIFLETFSVLYYALTSALEEMDLDVERVVLDRSNTAAQYLELLSTIPVEFSGDVLYLRDDDTAYLSSNGRGGDRVLYSLGCEDVRFYLETHSLVTGRQITYTDRRVARNQSLALAM
ncbi:MAG: hypothetical protein JWN02_2458 [Acidobacteria bacterium]|nr:hypothetical protein [Acidobacteriota bacterium]